MTIADRRSMTSLTTRLHTAFPHGTFRRHVLVLAGGTAIAQTLGVLTAPFLSRIYAPSDFGVFSVYVSILSVLLSIASLRYEFAIPLCETDEDALQVLALALLLVPIMTVLSVAALWVFRVALLEWTGTTAMGWYFWSLPVGMAAAGFYQVVSYWAVRRKAFSEIARTKVSQAASQIVACRRCCRSCQRDTNPWFPRVSWPSLPVFGAADAGSGGPLCTLSTLC